MCFLIYKKIYIKNIIDILPIIIMILSPKSLFLLKKLTINTIKKKLNIKNTIIFKKLAPNKEPTNAIITINKKRKIKNHVTFPISSIILNTLSLFNNYTIKDKYE